MEQGTAAGFRRQREYHWLRGGLYADLCRGNGVRSNDAGTERLYHGAGLCTDRDADGADRRGFQHCSGSPLYLCAGYGRQRRGSGNHSVSGNLLYLGAAVSDGAENAAAAEEGEHPTDAKAHPALCGAGNRHIYHAVQ